MNAPLRPFYVTGGKQKPVGPRPRDEWDLYEKGIILRVDPELGSVERSVEYITPPAYRPESESISFENGELRGDRLYVCTRTEALVYRLPAFEVLTRVSLPSFNDVHHVRPTPAGNLLVASTGLDMVIEATPEGSVVQEWDVLGEPLWSRFSRDVDYRKVPTTKPHRSHPNYTFFLGDEPWVTRSQQGDAVSLNDSRRRIPVGLRPGCHDGEVYRGKVYFTTVDGTVVIANAETLEKETVVDLNKIDNPLGSLLGWCSGLWIVDEMHVWVGFTRLRSTPFVENVRWVRRLIGQGEKPSHVALYDIAAKKCLADINVEAHGINMVCGIFPADTVLSTPQTPPRGNSLAVHGEVDRAQRLSPQRQTVLKRMATEGES